MSAKKSLNSSEDLEDELHHVEDELHEFEEHQTGVSRTLQIIVYPSLVAFVVLAAYGFYLVQSLATDVHRLTETIADMNGAVHSNMQRMSANMDTMSEQMDQLVITAQSMGSNMSHITESVARMDSSTRIMSTDVKQMNVSTQNMAASTYNMQRDMWSMNKNVSKPFKMMGKFMPFGNSGTHPYVVSPPPTPYYVHSQFNQWPYQTVLPQQPMTAPALPMSAEPVQKTTDNGSATVPVTKGKDNQPSATVIDDEGHSYFNPHQITNLVSYQY